MGVQSGLMPWQQFAIYVTESKSSTLQLKAFVMPVPWNDTWDA